MEKIYIYNGQETNYIITSDGKVFNRKTKKELKGTYSRNEYHSVQLTINGKPKSFMTHRLVAEMFCDNPNNYEIVDHIDRNKHNNDYTNLRWVNDFSNANNREKININYYEEKYLTNFKEKEWKRYKDTNYWVNEKGQIINKKTLRFLNGSFRNGYIRISMPKGKKESLHLIIWEAFNGKIPEGAVIDHIDGNRANNALSNLRLVSQSENIKNSHENGHEGDVKVKQYSLTGEYIKMYPSMKAASEEYGMSRETVRQAANRHGSGAGYFWIREDDDITIEELLKITKTGKPKKTYIGVTQYNLKGEKINHFNSIAAAARSVDCNSSTIKRAADNYRPTQGYIWVLDTQKFEDFKNILALKTL